MKRPNILLVHSHDLLLDPWEMNNLAQEAAHATVLGTMRQGLERWMRASDDPLLAGRIPAPAVALVNDPDSLSPGEPLLSAAEWEARHG